MTLTLAHRDFLLREQVIVPVCINFALNALAAWLTFRSAPLVSVWGSSGLWADILGTLFLLPLITCLIVTPVTRKGVLLGRVPSVPWRSSELPSLRWMPRRSVSRAVVLGMAAVVIFGPVSSLVMSWLRVTALPLAEVVVLKGAIGAFVAALVTPVAALYALGSAPLQARVSANDAQTFVAT